MNEKQIKIIQEEFFRFLDSWDLTLSEFMNDVMEIEYDES
jgi:hypothetical protein